jgi:hypothetical protein
MKIREKSSIMIAIRSLEGFTGRKEISVHGFKYFWLNSGQIRRNIRIA